MLMLQRQRATWQPASAGVSRLQALPGRSAGAGRAWHRPQAKCHSVLRITTDSGWDWEVAANTQFLLVPLACAAARHSLRCSPYVAD